MTAWTAESLPPELVAILDERAGRVHSPNGAVRSCLAEILNAYDAMRAEPADTAELVRLRAENRLLNALRDRPAGQCSLVRTHAPHRWLPNRAAGARELAAHLTGVLDGDLSVKHGLVHFPADWTEDQRARFRAAWDEAQR